MPARHDRIRLGRASVAALAVLCIGSVAVQGQALREMEFQEVPDMGLVVDDPGAAVLVVESTVTPLEFNSRAGIRQVRQVEPGVYHVLLPPGVHYVEVRADGYLVLKLPRWNFEPKSGRKIRLRPKLQLGAVAAFEADRPELRLEYAAGDAEVYVQLDDHPPQKLDFSRGHVVLRPTPGDHRVQVYAGGRVWQRTVSLATGDRRRETVSMAEGAASGFAASHPVNLFVESTPPGAAVYLNQVEQREVTPLALNDLQPGPYQLEVVLAQHLPEARQVVVQELEYTDVRVELTPNYGQVEIGSTPTGALVYLEGEQRGSTPFSTRLDAGVYPLRLVQAMYHDAQDTLVIEPGTQFRRTYPLRPRFGTLVVTSRPTGARVTSQGDAWGVTPLRREQVLSGRHVLQAELPGYPAQERAVDVADGQTHNLNFDLSASVGYLSAVSVPAGATVTVDGQDQALGRTPLERVPLAPGIYTLLFSLPDHDTAERRVPVAQGDAPRVEVALARHVGHVRVETTPPRARVLLDGEPKGQTPLMLRDVPTGQHRLRIEKEGYDPAPAQVAVTRDRVTDHRVTLGTAGTEAWKARRARARKLAVLPGLGQLASPGQAWRGLVYLTGTSGGLVFARLANVQYNVASANHRISLAKYRSSVHQADMDLHYRTAVQAIDDMESARTRFRAGVAVAAGLYATQWLDVLLTGGGRLEVRPQAAANSGPPGGLASAPGGLHLAWRF